MKTIEHNYTNKLLEEDNKTINQVDFIQAEENTAKEKLQQNETEISSEPMLKDEDDLADEVSEDVSMQTDSSEDSSMFEDDGKTSTTQNSINKGSNFYKISASQSVSELAETQTYFEWKIDNWGEDIGQTKSKDFILNGTDRVCFLTILRNIYDTKIVELDDKFIYNDTLIDVVIVSTKDNVEENLLQPAVDIYFLCDGDRINCEYNTQYNIIERNKNVLHATEIPQFDKKNSTLTICCEFKYVVAFFNSSATDENAQYNQSYTTKFILDNYEFLYKNQQLCDVTFKVGDALLKAHSFVLATISPYFFSMFTGENFKKTEDHVIDLSNDTEITCVAVQSFLEWSYGCKSINELSDVVYELLILAKKYDVQKLQSFCESYLFDRMHEDNLCKIILFTHKYNLEWLKAKAINYAKIHIDAIKNSPELAEMCKDANLIRELL